MIDILRNKKSIILIFIAIFSFAFFLGSQKAYAALKVDTGITVSPVDDRAQLDPGAVYTNSLTIRNNSDHDIKFDIEVLPFQVEKETAVPVYNVRNSYTQITNWIALDYDTDVLPAGKSEVVYYTVTVPKDAPGGGQYAAISITTRDATGENQSLKVDANINYIIAARISGVTRETGEIIEQKTSGFLLAPPIKASVKLSNTGNVDQDAKITVEIENAITGAKLYSNADSPKETSLLPETEKTVDLTFDNVLRLGVMRLNMTTDYINNHEKISRIIIICPIWLIFILIAIILLIVYKIASKKHNNSKKRSNSRGYETPSKDFNI